MSVELFGVVVFVGVTYLVTKIVIENKYEHPKCLKCDKVRNDSDKFCGVCGKRLKFPKVVYE